MRYPDQIYPADQVAEPREITARKIEALIRAMTQEEKESLLHGWENEADGIHDHIGNGGFLPGIPRLGIPEIRMYDGPAGVTSDRDTTGLPVQHVLGGTWSPEIAYRFGEVTGSENRMIAGNCQLGAQFDVCRIPHYVRNKDSMGEDPVIVETLAPAETKGIQDQKTMACVKHLAFYTQKPLPFPPLSDCIIDEQTAQELYLPGYGAALREGGAAALMTAAHGWNGEYITQSEVLLREIVRGQWGFEGMIMSDWAISTEIALDEGLDLEMPFGEHRGGGQVIRALEAGTYTQDQEDEALRHILNAMARAGFLCCVRLDASGNVIEEAGRTQPIRISDTYDTKEAHAVRERNAGYAAQIVEKGAVLMKNENQVLPACSGKYRSVAVIGPGGVIPVTGEGQERSYGTIRRFHAPADELKKQLADMEVESEAGLLWLGETIPEEALFQDAACVEHGVRRTYGITAEDHDAMSPKGPMGGGIEIVLNTDADEVPMKGFPTGGLCGIDPVIDFHTAGGSTESIFLNGENGNALPQGSVFTWNGYIKAPEDGIYTIQLHAMGGESVLWLEDENGTLRIFAASRPREGAQWPWEGKFCTDTGMNVIDAEVSLKAGEVRAFKLCSNEKTVNRDLQNRLAWITPSMKLKARERAVRLCAEKDLTILFVYQGSQAENMFEGTLGSLDLDPVQKEFVQTILQTAKKNGKRTAVVLNISHPILMKDWIENADAVLNLWLPGQEGGSATARLLTGAVNPGGKLTMTFPAEDQDTPVTDTQEHYRKRYLGIPEENPLFNRVEYDEGIFTGYRWYEKEGIKPLFAFGHGLSYTQFAYRNAEAICDGESCRVRVTLENTGDRTGDEVIEVYAGKGTVPDYIQMPEKKLVGFLRAEDLQPGEIRTVEISFPMRRLCVWDVNAALKLQSDGSYGKWHFPEDRRRLLIGASSEDIRLRIRMIMK